MRGVSQPLTGRGRCNAQRKMQCSEARRHESGEPGATQSVFSVLVTEHKECADQFREQPVSERESGLSKVAQ